MRSKDLREWLREHHAIESAKVKAKDAEAEAEAKAEAEADAEGETLGSESEEREIEAKEGTADGVEERETKNWEKVVELVRLAFCDEVILEETIPIYELPSSIDDSVPTEQEVEWTVSRIWGY